MTDFKTILLKDIRPDANQPRRIYDEAAMQELTQSVKEKGILQPILLRPNGKGFILVCGERRFRAAGSAGLLDIPAVIRELTDDEALELQIIENLQRKDVHPMEEAVAFKSLLEKKNWTVEEVAHRIGKNQTYVRQRIRLSQLSTKWQKIFFKNGIFINDALRICVLPEKQQKDLYDDCVDPDDEKSDHPKIQINTYRFEQLRGELHKASFELADPTLDKKMGPCTSCQYNTATALLFESDKDSPRCTNISCFKHKTDIHFERELKRAQEDPQVILVNGASGEAGLIQKLKKEGHQVLREYSEYEPVYAPEKPDWEEYKGDNYDEDDNTEEEVRRDFEKELTAYEKELQDYNKKVSGSQFKKAFVVDDSGDERGKYIHIKLKKTAGAKAVGGNDAPTTDAESITEEIKRIQAREKRSKELDQAKFWEDLRTHFRPEPNVPSLTGELTATERECLAETILNQMDFPNRETFQKFFKIKGEKIGAVGPEILLKMLRYFFLAELPPQVVYGNLTPDALLCVKLGKEYFPTVIDQVEATRKEAINKRVARVDERIAKLQAQKKDLTNKTPAAKPAAPKAPAKKKVVAKKTK